MKVVRAFSMLSDNRETYYVSMSVTKDSAFAAMAGKRYKVAFRRVQWVFSIDQCISSLFFFIIVL